MSTTIILEPDVQQKLAILGVKTTSQDYIFYAYENVMHASNEI
jgi:hypothetical protein